ncbi:hypothetical protein AVEN_120579-1 [Araneus ventricosus]|uniref:Uncharacterized protein n=1 Tax=Araneus ventricosus TaxID=182803 RepID=A0A4Y2H9M4_ARAVE|nr:hypothetical protein AVEN_120579-1 [Araneus ventricosus]
MAPICKAITWAMREEDEPSLTLAMSDRRLKAEKRQEIYNQHRTLGKTTAASILSFENRLLIWFLGAGMNVGIPSCVAVLASTSAASLPLYPT